jgi:hypothetical protein
MHDDDWGSIAIERDQTRSIYSPHVSDSLRGLPVRFHGFEGWDL